MEGYAGVSASKTFEMRDVVSGFIKFDTQEREIINHPAFQRLRRIKQLALTNMVYPGAEHTRFEHSLGVMQMATDMYDCITEKSTYLLEHCLSMDPAGTQRWRKVIRLAALLHDVGHAPFSHAGEDLLPMNMKSDTRFTHEDYSIAIIKHCFKDIIETHPINNNYVIKVDEVTALLGDPSVKPTALSLLWKELISGQLDADKADYLLRDSLHLGVNYGIYDKNRLTRCMGLGILETEAPIIAIQDGGWHIAESLVIARYQMFNQVYFHKTRRIYDHHLYKATKEILRRKGAEYYPAPSDFRDFLEFNDWTMLGELSAKNGGEHGEIVLNRNHYRCELETGLSPTEEEEKDIIKIQENFEKDGKKTFLDDKATTSWYKFEKDIYIFDKKTYKTKPLSTESNIVKSMVSIPRLRRLYVER